MEDIIESLSRLGIVSSTSNPNATNETGSSPDGLPSDMLGALLSTAGLHSSPLLQLVLFVHRKLSTQLGIDPSLVITLLGLLWSMQYLATQVWIWLEDLIERHLMCCISINQGDTIYDHVMAWLSSQPKLRRKRFLTAQTLWRSAWEEDETDDDEDEAVFPGGSNNGLRYTEAEQGGEGAQYLNFSNHAARAVSNSWL